MRNQSTVPYWAVDPFFCFICRHFSLVEKNQATFSILSTLAKAVLAIPASAAKSERVFSKGGLLVTPKRTCLSEIYPHFSRAFEIVSIAIETSIAIASLELYCYCYCYCLGGFPTIAIAIAIGKTYLKLLLLLK